jgi:hypothetical protein
VFILTILQKTDDRIVPDASNAMVGGQKADDPGVMIKTTKIELHEISDLHRSLPSNIGSRTMLKSLPLPVALIFVFSITFFTVLPGQRLSAADQSTIDRLNQLEAETQALRAEVSRMRQDVVRLPGVEPAPAPAPMTTVSNSTDPTAQTVASTATEGDYYTLDQIKTEMKKLVWKKGDFTVTPYGYLWAATTYETERTNNGDYTYYVYSAQDQGEPTFHVDAKSTRIGLDVLGPRIACLNCAQSGGKVEFDFQGASAQENKGAVLLRHAYWEVKDEEFRLLGGQTWDIISPLYPGTIMYTVYWGAGNIGYRRAQFRGERYIAFSDELLLTVQGSINGDIIADTAPTGITASGDQAEWPVLEGRTALTFGPRGKDCHPITLGVSSHVGEQRFTFVNPNPAKDLRSKTWSLNADLKVPVTDRLGFQGEFQCGENLSSFQGGILQGYDFVLRESIYDTGGWMEVWYDWTSRWHSHVGYCVDDPLDSDISAGGRTYNSAYFGNILYDVTKQFTCGLEASSWRTLYQGKEPGEAARIEFMARYGF